jgi:ABC-2 type transport system ATP-binding protein
MTIAIEVRGLRVRRGVTQVFDGLDVDVVAGRVTGLIGPSGCGKTTLIRCVMGIQKVRAGTITVDGIPAGSPALRNRVTYSSQDAGVYLDLTVRQNVSFFTRVHGLPATEIDRVIDGVGLSGQAKQRAATLSGGQLRRVSLAIALLGRPDVVVLDEPTVGLDPVLREDLWTMFAGMAARGTTLLVSSHVMDEASRCDHLLLLRKGRLLASLSPAELLATSGQADAEHAFLELIRREDASCPSPSFSLSPAAC